MPLRGARILVIDDDAAILYAIQDYLRAHGCEAHCTGNVAEVLTLLNAASYSAVIADLNLGATGSMDGLKILRAVKERFPATAVVLLTASGSPSIEREARRGHVDAILDKPIPLARLVQVVTNLVAEPDREGR